MCMKVSAAYTHADLYKTRAQTDESQKHGWISQNDKHLLTPYRPYPFPVATYNNIRAATL